MKIIKWLFNFAQQYRNDRRKYEKSGIGGKITILLLYMGFAALGIWMELVTFKMFAHHFGWAILLAILTVGVITVTVKSCGTYCAIAFLNIPRAKIKKKVEDATLNAIEQSLGVENSGAAENVDSQAQEEAIEEAKNAKAHKIMDIIGGILYGLCSAGVFITAIVLIFLKLQMKI